MKGFVPRSEELSFPPGLESEMVSRVESCAKNVKAYEEVNCREKTEKRKGGRRWKALKAENSSRRMLHACFIPNAFLFYSSSCTTSFKYMQCKTWRERAQIRFKNMSKYKKYYYYDTKISIFY